MKMPTGVGQIVKMIDKLDEICEKRNDAYWNASEEWQESDKGEGYDDVTEGLKEVLAELQEWLGEYYPDYVE